MDTTTQILILSLALLAIPITGFCYWILTNNTFGKKVNGCLLISNKYVYKVLQIINFKIWNILFFILFFSLISFFVGMFLLFQPQIIQSNFDIGNLFLFFSMFCFYMYATYLILKTYEFYKNQSQHKTYFLFICIAILVASFFLIGGLILVFFLPIVYEPSDPYANWVILFVGVIYGVLILMHYRILFLLNLNTFSVRVFLYFYNLFARNDLNYKGKFLVQNLKFKIAKIDDKLKKPLFLKENEVIELSNHRNDLLSEINKIQVQEKRVPRPFFLLWINKLAFNKDKEILSRKTSKDKENH